MPKICIEIHVITSFSFSRTDYVPESIVGAGDVSATL